MPLKKFLFRRSLIGTTKGSFFAAIALIIVLGVTTLISPQPSQLVLWSWQRQDNVSFINKNILIALLVGTIAVNGNNFQASAVPRIGKIIIFSVRKLYKNAQIGRSLCSLFLLLQNE